MPTDYKVTILPAGVAFECAGEETILEAAIRSGLSLPYGCRKGNCGTCKAQVLEGETDLETESAYGLSMFERDRGFTLLCSAYPLADVTVEVEGLDASEAASIATPPATYSGTIRDVRALTHDVRALELVLDRPMEFRAGTFAQLNAPGTDCWRSYSMSSPPSEAEHLEFLVKVIPGGRFSSCLERMTAGDEVRLNGPHGSFWIRDHERPLVLVGGGVGVGPLLSMIAELAARRDPRPVRMFYGVRTPADLFYIDRALSIAEPLPDFELTASFSDIDADIPGYARGLVSDVIERQLGPELHQYDAYLCGPPPMIDATLRILESHGLEERRSIYYDKFTAS